MIEQIQEFILHESIHITLLFSLIITFYFIYVSYEQKRAVQDTVGTSLVKLIELLPVSIRKQVVDSILRKMKEQYEKDEKIVKSSRNKYLIWTLIGIVIISVLFIILNYTMYKKSPKTYPNPTKIILVNIVSVFILGIIVFIFFQTVILKMKSTTLNIAIYDYLKDLDIEVLKATEIDTQLDIENLLNANYSQ